MPAKRLKWVPMTDKLLWRYLMASSALANCACAVDKLKLPMSKIEARERNFMNFIANRIQVVKQDGEINSEINITDVERIVISDYCLQSSPCQHDCEIYYKDGSMKKIRHDGRYIAQNYFYILNDQDKMHFYVYLK